MITHLVAMHLLQQNTFSWDYKFTLYTHMPIEVSELAGDDLHAGHDMLEELHVDLL